MANGDTNELIKDGIMLAWITERPAYCTRGRYHANFTHEAVMSMKKDKVPGPQSVDIWPRYYFDLAAGCYEVERWLEAHGVDTIDSAWYFKDYSKGQVDMDVLVKTGKIKIIGE